jgi:diguanylate cyclase (GGDEF)-like protein
VVVLATVVALLTAAGTAGPLWFLLRRERRSARRAADLLTRTVDALPVAMVVAAGSGPVVMNREAARIIGVGEKDRPSMPELTAGRRRTGTTAEGEEVVLGPLLARVLAGEQPDLVLRTEPVDGEAGRPRWLALRARPVRTCDGAVAGAVLLFEDRTDQHEAEQAVSRQLDHVEAVGEAVRAVLRRQDGSAAIVTAAQHITGAASVTLWQPDAHGDIVCTSSFPETLVGLRTPVDGEGAVARCLASGRPVRIGAQAHPGLDKRLLRSATATTGLDLHNGEAFPIVDAGVCLGVLGLAWEPGQDGLGRNRAMLELLATETALALAHRELLMDLERMSVTDALTGLANRRAWEAAIRTNLALAAREDRPLSVLMIDLDHFKAFNDNHGHATGDEFLRSAARAWSHRLRSTDLLCRWGGEEFVVMLFNCDLHGARTVADELRTGMPSPMTCSVGVAEWDRRESVDTLMSRADACLYAAKATGRDRVCTTPDALDRPSA